MSHTKVYPGLICNSTEFFVHENDIKVIQDGSVKNFEQLPFATIQILKEAIAGEHNVQTALKNIHPGSDMKRLEQFVRCRFGGLDFQADIKEGILQDGEYWPCPNRGNCSYEGLLCKLPIVNGQRLAKKQVEFMQLGSTNYTNEAIAEIMDMPLGTMHQLKKSLYKQLGIQTKQEGSVMAKDLNLI